MKEDFLDISFNPSDANQKILSITMDKKNKLVSYLFKNVDFDLESGLIRTIINYNNKIHISNIDYYELVIFLKNLESHDINYTPREIKLMLTDMLERIDFQLGIKFITNKYIHMDIQSLTSKVASTLINNKIPNDNQMKIIIENIKKKLYEFNNHIYEDSKFNGSIEANLKKILLLLENLHNIQFKNKQKKEYDLTFTIYDFLFDEN